MDKETCKNTLIKLAQDLQDDNVYAPVASVLYALAAHVVIDNFKALHYTMKAACLIVLQEYPELNMTKENVHEC